MNVTYLLKMRRRVASNFFTRKWYRRINYYYAPIRFFASHQSLPVCVLEKEGRVLRLGKDSLNIGAHLHSFFKSRKLIRLRKCHLEHSALLYEEKDVQFNQDSFASPDAVDWAVNFYRYPIGKRWLILRMKFCVSLTFSSLIARFFFFLFFLPLAISLLTLLP